MIGWHVLVFKVKVVEIVSIAISGDLGEFPGLYKRRRHLLLYRRIAKIALKCPFLSCAGGMK
jgi:hypothetical protein